MDERRSQIQELESKNYSDNETRNQLLQKLGEALIQRIGEGEPFPVEDGNTPGGIFSEYRKFQKEIQESKELIKTLEEDIIRLKELEDQITADEDEKNQLERDLSEIYLNLGRIILSSSDEPDEITAPFKQQEMTLVVKIEENTNKVAELESRDGNFLVWLGKNAQIAVTKAFLLKNQTDLERLYRSAGEKLSSTDSAESADESAHWRSSEEAVKAAAYKERLSAINVNLAMLKGERRQIGGLFEADVSPARRIQGLEKRIAFVNEEFPGVYLRFGSLVTEGGGGEILSSLLIEEDHQILENAGLIKDRIAGRDLEIAKIKAAISIDNEKAEIEKAKRAIMGQQQKIAAAQDAIADFEKQIAESERSIEELEAFIRG